MRRPKHLSRLLPGAYLALVGIAGVYLGYRLLLAPVNSEFAGIPSLILALPWSDWFARHLGVEGLVGWLGMAAGIAANTMALGAVGCLLRGIINISDSGSDTA